MSLFLAHLQLPNPRSLLTLFPVFTALGLLATSPITVQAADADALAKQANAELRSAERDMFGGKKESADQKLNQVAKTLAELKQANPSHSNLNSLESKFKKLRQDLDRRMNKPSPSTAIPAPTTAPPKALTPTRTTASSADTARMNRDLQKAVKDVDYALGRLETLMAEDNAVATQQPIEQRQKRAQGYLGDAEGYLAKVEDKYGDQLPRPNPDFEAARAKIAEAQNRADAWIVQVQKQTAEQAAAKTSADRQAANQAAEADADASRMIALDERYSSQLEPMHGNSLVYGIRLEDAQKALEQIEMVEQQVLPQLAPELGRLADKYGKEAMTINNRLFEMGCKTQGDPGGKLSRMIEAVANVSASRRASGASVVHNVETLLSAFSNQLTDARIKRMNDAKALLVVGQQLDPANEEIKKRLASIDDEIADASERMEEAINARTWADNIDAFEGPGDVKSLSAAALEFFRKDRDWGALPNRQIEILAVCVRGPWKVAERDVFGRVIRWRLPIHTAVTDEKLRPRNLARVYELSIVAQEGTPNKAPQAPPFDGCWVGNSWMMRLDKF